MITPTDDQVEAHQTHAIERTSPKGQAFVGTCKLCGTTGLTMSDALRPCENIRQLSTEQVILEAVEKTP